MKQKFHQSLSLFIFFIPLTILLNSCGGSDFTSVENFAKNETKIQNDSNGLAQDIYDSCLRRTNYIILTTSEGISTRENTLQDCMKYNKPNVQKLKDANDVLIKYMTALSQVASGQTVSFAQNITNLQTALTSLKVGNFQLSSPVVQAGTNIVQIIVNALSKEKRGRALKKAILCSNDSLQTYITGNSTFNEKIPPSGGLIELVTDGYINGIMKIEKAQINSYYGTYFGEIQASTDPSISTALEVQKDYNEAMETVQTKVDTAQDYITVLETTAKTHNDLRNDFSGTGKNAITPAEVKELCQSVFAGKQSSLEKSKQATKLDISEYQMKKAEKILSDYSQKIKNLHKKRKKIS